MATLGGVTIDGRFSDGRLLLAMSGRADFSDGAELTRSLLGWHSQILARGATHADVDFTGLETMSSSALVALIDWVSAMRSVPSGGYQISFRGNPNRRWQHACLRAVASFAPTQVSVRFDE